MAEIKISCSHCGQHIQCDEGYGGHQINCPHCQQAFIVPQIVRAEPLPLPTATPVPPPAARLGIKRPQRPDYVAEAQVWETGEVNTPVKGRESISNGTKTISLILIGLVTAVAIYYFSTGSSLLTSIDNVESEVKASIQTKLAQDPATSSTKIKSFHLVHESGNKYKGMLEAQTGGNIETVEVEVTYDGRTFMWKIQPQAAPDNTTAEVTAPAPAMQPPTMPADLDPTTGLPYPQNDTHTDAQNKAVLDFAFEGIKIGDTLSSVKQKFPKMELLAGAWNIDSPDIKTADNSICYFQNNKLVQFEISYDSKRYPKWKTFNQELVTKFGKADSSETGNHKWYFIKANRIVELNDYQDGETSSLNVRELSWQGPQSPIDPTTGLPLVPPR